MCQWVPPPPPTQNLCLHRCIDVSGQARYVNDTAEKIAIIRIPKNAPKKFPDIAPALHTYYGMPLDKLYARVRCSICGGGHIYNSGHHNPINPTQYRHCPYCDHQGLTLIEVTKEIVVEYVCENEEILKLVLEKAPNQK